MHRSNLALFLISSWVYMGLAHVVQKCSEIMHRREFRDLPLPDRIAFFQTIKTMKNAPSEMDQANRFEDFTFIHWHNQHHAHKTPHFFPWHRHFLFVFENDLKRFSGNSSMTLPFFDWTLDAHQLEKSALLQPDTFGTSGDSKSRCLVDGQFARWNRTIPNSSCVKRSGRPILPELHSSKQISALIETITDYNEFWKVMELGPHNKFHQVIGGDFDTMFSTNDPLFFCT